MFIVIMKALLATILVIDILSIFIKMGYCIIKAINKETFTISFLPEYIIAFVASFILFINFFIK